MRVVGSRSSARYVSMRVSKSPVEWQRVPLQASDTALSTYTLKNGSNSVPIDDLKEKGNTEVTDSEEETDDEGSSKGAEERVRTPARKQLRRYDKN